jgi:hypothetical protein
MNTRKPLNILTIVNDLTLDKSVLIWHYISRFKRNFDVNMYVGIENDIINPFSSEQLLFKIYNMAKKDERDYPLYFVTPTEVKSVVNEVSDNYKYLLEKYIVKKGQQFVLYIHPTTIFSQNPPLSMYENIEKGEVFFFADGYCYYKDIVNYCDNGWHNLSKEYPFIDRELTSSEKYIAATFSEQAKTGQYFRSWYNFVEEKYKSGEEMFPV